MKALLPSCFDLRRTARGFALVLSGLILSSCEDGPTAPTAADYQGVEWRLASLQHPDFSVAEAPTGASFTALFGDDAQLSARADCNVCHAGYSASDTVLSVSPMACTRAFCSSAPFDSEYVRALSTATSFEMDDDGLTVRSSEGTLRFVR